MRRKDDSVETEFHPILTAFLFDVDELYREWEDEVVITSGSEASTRHKYSSFHYAIPGCAADTRIWDRLHYSRGKVPVPTVQYNLMLRTRDQFCARIDIPKDWIDIVLERKKNHIHSEFQPKRRRN